MDLVRVVYLTDTAVVMTIIIVVLVIAFWKANRQ